MSVVLDHLVYAGPDLAKAVAAVEELTGVKPAPGGSHNGLGTANYLVDLGAGAYLEIIGPDPAQPRPVRPRPFGIDDLTEPRLLAWAVRTTNLDAQVASARKAGFDPGEPMEMTRSTAEGTQLSWRLTPPPADGSLAPFLIDWGTTPHPTTRGLPKVPLLMVTARHPSPAEVERVLDALGLELLVRKAEVPGLVAALSRPDGRQVALS